jgi:hypothetical protein
MIPLLFGKQEVGIWWVKKRFPRYEVPIWSMWPNIRSLPSIVIWSQALYRYPISWEAFLDPSDSYFLFADFVDFYTHWTYMLIFRVTKYQISAINSCWEKCDEKCAYIFNVYKNQLSRQTGSRNLTGPKTLPTIWYTYSWFLYTLNIYAHFSSHFSQQLLMAEIWYLVTSFI